MQAPLPLLFSNVAPRCSVFNLNSPRARSNPTERKPHQAAKQSHAHPDPPDATRIEISHG
jgi:hypothetical protein